MFQFHLRTLTFQLKHTRYQKIIGKKGHQYRRSYTTRRSSTFIAIVERIVVSMNKFWMYKILIVGIHVGIDMFTMYSDKISHGLHLKLLKQENVPN